MADPVTVAELRASMAIVDRHPGSSTEAWRERAHAQHVLADWRAWLPGLLDAAFPVPPESADPGMCQAEAEARGLV